MWELQGCLDYPGSVQLSLLNALARRQGGRGSRRPTRYAKTRSRAIFGDEPQMTLMGFVLATQKAAVVDHLTRNSFLDLALTHEIEKPHFVLSPFGQPLPVVIEH